MSVTIVADWLFEGRPGGGPGGVIHFALALFAYGMSYSFDFFRGSARMFADYAHAIKRKDVSYVLWSRAHGEILRDTRLVVPNELMK